MWLIYFIFCILRPVCIPLPEAGLVVLGGLCCNQAATFFLGVIGTAIGLSAMYFVSARWMEYLAVKGRIGEGVARFRTAAVKYRFLLTGTLFVIPVFPDIIICAGASAVHIKYSRFLMIAVFSKCISIGMVAFSDTLGTWLNLNKYIVILIELVLVSGISVIMKKTQKGVQ